MSVISISQLRRRGTSTILGTLIFVGILFSSVLPMFLVIRQADTYFERSKFELERLDDERRNEDLYVFVSPTGQFSTELRVSVENKGELADRIKRLWINDDPVELDFPVQPMSGLIEVGVYPVSEEPDSYYIMVTTDRGNVVAFDTPLNWEGELTGWQTDVFSINVLISSLPGHEFKIEITEGETLIAEGQTEKFDPKFFIVPNPVTYTVTILRGTNPIYVEEVTITWPEGSPVEWVFA